jgi:glycerol kinase
VFSSRDELAAAWALDRRFEPRMAADERLERRAGWRAAVQRVLTSNAPGARD